MLTPETIEKYDAEHLEALLTGGADPHIRDCFGNTLLHLVLTMKGKTPGEILAMAEVLLRHGLDPNVRNRFGHTPLYFAGKALPDEVVELIEQHGGRWY